MAFTDLNFLSRFLVIFLVIYFLSPRKYQTLELFLVSLVFYAFGDLKYLPLLLFLCAVNYTFAMLVYKKWRGKQKLILAGIIGIDVFALVLFKILSYFTTTTLPLGISFYIFKMISLQADLYTGKIKKMPGLVTMACYFTMFFQMTQGPIMRFETKEFTRRRHRFSFKRIEEGLKYLILGMAMKVLLADRLAILWNEVSKIGYGSISTPLAWFGLIGYSLELYLDFWGYSLMAAGIGMILGFSFVENFDHPYAALSVGEFYRRWHITLTSWFKDYVYIPLGGSRLRMRRTLLNIMLVWLLTGFWHGGALHYILWGLALGVIICLEKVFSDKLSKLPNFGRRIIVIVIIPLTWMIFAVERTADIGIYFTRLLPLTGKFAGANAADFGKLFGHFWLYVVAGIVMCVPVVYKQITKPKTGMVRYVEAGVLCVLLWISLYFSSISQANPFLYVQF